MKPLIASLLASAAMLIGAQTTQAIPIYTNELVVTSYAQDNAHILQAMYNDVSLMNGQPFAIGDGGGVLWGGFDHEITQIDVMDNLSQLFTISYYNSSGTCISTTVICMPAPYQNGSWDVSWDNVHQQIVVTPGDFN